MVEGAAALVPIKLRRRSNSLPDPAPLAASDGLTGEVADGPFSAPAGALAVSCAVEEAEGFFWSAKKPLLSTSRLMELFRGMGGGSAGTADVDVMGSDEEE